MTDAEFVSSIQPTTDFVGENIDVLEEDIYALSPYLLRILLQDKSTGHFIRWGCDNYKKYGDEYTAEKEIFPRLIIGRNTTIIQPRIAKSKSEQKNRTRESAEVFTPSWICNEMNNACDEEYFGRTNVFNVVQEKDWMPVTEPIEFKENKNKDLTEWKKYVDSRRLEITCGEAPYLVSRYDTTTGEFLPLEKRIGLLDRKLRIVHENTMTEAEWFVWAKRAFESIYGYEFQGDNLLLARENLLLTFIDYFKFKFNKTPKLSQLKIIANVIAWNIWQMDGLTDTAPYSVNEQSLEIDLFEKKEIVQEKNKDRQGRKNPVVDLSKVSPVLCQIRNWRSGRSFYFKDLKGEKTMKFDVVIGNPPYQEIKGKSDTQTQGNSTWIYPYFQIAADNIAECSCLIYPFGGWFDSPERLNGLGLKLLKDKRTVFIHAYEGTTDKRAWYRNDKIPQPIFGISANLSAGVSIVFRTKNENKSFKYFNRMYSDEEVKINYDEDIDLTPNPMFVKIYKKLGNKHINDSIQKGIFGIESDYVEKNPEKVSFTKEDWDTPIQLLTNDKSGSSGRAKLYWTDKNNIPKGKELIDYYKVIMTSAYPKKTIVSSIPTIENVKARLKLLIELMPQNSAFGRSRLSLFMSKNKRDCENFIKYTQTNFFAGLVLQEPNRRASFGLIIPNQDFTENSDIDWSKSIPEIDQQLYKKYDLSDEEIAFIETHVKEMA